MRFVKLLITTCLLVISTAVYAADAVTVLATTTTDNSGLLGYLTPKIEAATGLKIRAVISGTGQALAAARRGDGDLLLVHEPEQELAFMAKGWGKSRREIMANRFVIVGPAEDPARIARGHDAAATMRAIAAEGWFISRADLSGTNITEHKLWQKAGIDPAAVMGSRYRQAGVGMGAALNMAAASGAYTLSDIATWMSFKNRQGLTLLVDPLPKIANIYSVIVVNPARLPDVKAAAAERMADWLCSAAGQKAIADFKINGIALFDPRCQKQEVAR